MTREDHQMRIRLPEELRGRIEAAADAAGRSMNAEIVYRLSASFTVVLPSAPGDPKSHALAEFMQALSAAGHDVDCVTFEVRLKPGKMPRGRKVAKQ